ncbi:MAG: fluoride efflux transporter CrcB [Roseburia sp.]|nr:fluoride efflux transporter CrcB [Roseburia sp.]
MQNCLVVGIGGFIGAVLRYLISLVPVKSQAGFPLKTLIINITGAFLIGLIAAWATKNHVSDSRMVLFLKVGICGGFTTFSTFAFESTELMQKGHAATALTYMLLSVGLGVLAVFAAQALVK